MKPSTRLWLISNTIKNEKAIKTDGLPTSLRHSLPAGPMGRPVSCQPHQAQNLTDGYESKMQTIESEEKLRKVDWLTLGVGFLAGFTIALAFLIR